MDDNFFNSLLQNLDNHADNQENYLEQQEENLLTYFNDQISSEFYLISKKSSFLKETFFYLAINTIKKAILLFYKNKYNRNNINNFHFKAYVLLSIKSLRKSILIRADGAQSKYSKVFTCPACKNQCEIKPFVKDLSSNSVSVENNKQILMCNSCEEYLLKIDEILKNEKKSQKINAFMVKKNLHEIFKEHSIKGKKCPECKKFIPQSHLDGNNNCPHLKCSWFGNPLLLNKMNHPFTKTGKNLIVSYNIQLDGNYVDSNALNTAIVRENVHTELTLLESSVSGLIEKIKKTQDFKLSYRKIFMLQAFQNMIKKDPTDMIKYLCFKQITENAIQSRIFQEYVSIIENNMPIDIIKNKNEKTIYSLTDPDLGLFLGLSEFKTIVLDDLSINNKTKEEYIGPTGKCYGPCYIGHLIDVKDANTNQSYINNVVNYTFSNIFVKDIVPLTPVIVSHFRISSHDDMLVLSLLRITRKKILNSLNIKKQILSKPFVTAPKSFTIKEFNGQN